MKRLACVLMAVALLAGCDFEVGDAGDTGHSEAMPGIDPVVVTDANFNEVVMESSQPVMVDCWAEWCGPCLELAPTVHELAAEYKGRVVVAQLDIDDNASTADNYNVHSIPTLLFFKDGKLVDQIVGVRPKEELTAKLDGLLEGSQAGAE